MANKKNGKLTFQVLAVMVPIIIIMTSVILFIVHKSTVDGYLKAKNELISDKLSSTEFGAWYMPPIDKTALWYFNYYEAHPDVLKESITEEEQQKANEVLGEDASTFILFENEQLDTLDPITQTYAAKKFYELICNLASSTTIESDLDCAFLVVTQGQNNGKLLYSIENGKLNKEDTMIKMYDLSEHRELEEAISENNGTLIFERTRHFMFSGDYYIGYKPIVLDGKTVAVMGLAYNWSSFSDVMSKTFKSAFILAMTDVILAGAALVVLLYRRVLRPVGRIEHSLTEYMESKDSAAVKGSMEKVKVNNEIGRLSDKVSDLAVEIDHYMDENIKLVMDKQQIETELEVAKDIQASQLPDDFPDREEFDIYASMTPAKEVGGDFYDFFFVDDDHLAMVIADVSGKGVPAALFMMMSKMLINDYTLSGLSPHEILEHVNNALCRSNSRKMFVTVWLGILEISTGRLVSANAGHEYPIVRQPDGSFEAIKGKHDFVLGILKDKKYSQQEMTLQKGAALFVYTDGVPEAINADEELFGLERTVEALNKAPDAKPRELLENVGNAVFKFAGDAPQFDDITMLAVKLNKDL